MVRCILPFGPLAQGGQAVKQALLTVPEMWGGTLGWASLSQTAQHGVGVSVTGHLPSIIMPGLLLSARKWKQAKHGSSIKVSLARPARLLERTWGFQHAAHHQNKPLTSSAQKRCATTVVLARGPTHEDKPRQVATPLPTEACRAGDPSSSDAAAGHVAVMWLQPHVQWACSQLLR